MEDFEPPVFRRQPEIDANADVLALEGRLNVVIVTRRQEEGVFVQGVARAGRELQPEGDGQRRLDLEVGAAGRLDERQHFLMRLRSAPDLVALPIIQHSFEPGDGGRPGAGKVFLKERLLVKIVAQLLDALLKERIHIGLGGIDVGGADDVHHLVVDLERLGGGELGDGVR